MNSMPPDYWGMHGELADKRNKELVSVRSRTVKPYEELEAQADPAFRELLTPENFTAQYERLQRAIDATGRILREKNPDTVVIISDDQDEMLFEDNMPSIMVYWGETMKLRPGSYTGGEPPPSVKAAMWGYGDQEMEVPVDHELGKHLVEYLVEAEFDIAHSRYMKETYGGSIGPAGYVWWKRETKERPQGMPHGFSYIVKRVMDNNPIAILPVFQNTCYPPNQPTPRRSYALGKAIRAAIEEFPGNRRVCIIGSGGLSHFVLDEETDRLALNAMKNKDAEALCSIPRERLLSASSEIQNWIAAAGACEHLDFEIIDYVPVVRTAAGTGGGWGFAHWQ
jgi:hypothetical protein